MNKKELAVALADKTGVSQKDAKAAIEAIISIVEEELVKGEKVQIADFGNFEVATRAERVGRNPQTKETITIPASKSPKFKAAKKLKDAINA